MHDHEGRRSSTPISTRSTPRSSSATTRDCAPPRHRRRRHRARRQLRGQALRRLHTHARVQGPPAGPTWSSCRPASTPTPRPAGRCSRCSTTRRRSSRGCRSTRPSSTWAACAGSPAIRSTSPGLRAGSARPGRPADHGRYRRTKFLAKVASGWRSPTACCWSSPGSQWSSSIRSPSGSCGVSARSPSASSTIAASTPWARWRGSASRNSSRSSASRPGGSSMRSPTIATCALSRPVAGATRSDRSRHSRRGPKSTESIETLLLLASSTASRAGCALPGGPVARSHCASGTTTSGAPRGALARPPHSGDQPHRGGRHVDPAVRARHHRRAGLTLIGLSVGNLMSLDGAAAMPEQLLLPFGRKDQTPLDTTLDSLRERFGRSVLARRRCSGAT